MLEGQMQHDLRGRNGARLSDHWRLHLPLFDPQNALTSLLEGLRPVLEDRFEAFFESQIAIAKRDPKLAAFLTAQAVEESRSDGIKQFHARFTPPLSDEFASYTRRFARLLVRIGASPHTAMALVSCAYGEAMKVAMERLEGEPKARAMRGIRMLTSIESDIMTAAMHQELGRLHAEQLRKQADAFENSVLETARRLGERSARLRDSSKNASSVSRDLREASCAVAVAADQSATAMEDAKHSVVSLGQTVETVRSSVENTDEAAQDASRRATASAATARQLSSTSSQIESLVRLIRSISEQTQMLALNATIEAARAGDRGAGFAVVANEVKSLASKTRDATADITRQVDEILAATGESADAASEISERMSTIGAGTEGVRREIEEQVTTIGVITDAIAETFTSAEHVSDKVASINGLASQVADRFADVEADSAILDDLLGRLADDVRDYRSSFERLTSSHLGGAD